MVTVIFGVSAKIDLQRSHLPEIAQQEALQHLQDQGGLSGPVAKSGCQTFNGRSCGKTPKFGIFLIRGLLGSFISKNAVATAKPPSPSVTVNPNSQQQPTAAPSPPPGANKLKAEFRRLLLPTIITLNDVTFVIKHPDWFRRIR